MFDKIPKACVSLILEIYSDRAVISMWVYNVDFVLYVTIADYLLLMPTIVCTINHVGGTCVTSDTRVVRDIHYDGHPIEERATIITRIAPTFLR